MELTVPGRRATRGGARRRPLNGRSVMSQHRVLIADPDESLLARYRAYLTKEGFAVSTARTALECMERLADRAPDVLVLEPELMSDVGNVALAGLTDGDDLPWIHVIVLTAGDR